MSSSVDPDVNSKPAAELEVATVSTCNVCKAETLLKCTGCQKVSYCSAEHQAEDWEAHKSNCAKKNKKKKKKSKSAKKSSNAGSTIPATISSRFTVDAILFPADESAPRIVKAEYEVTRDPNIDPDENFHKPLSLDKYLGAQAGQQLIDRHDWPHGPAIGELVGVNLFFRDNCLNDGSRPNQSVRAICDGSPGHGWAGNMLAVYTTNYLCGQVADLSVDLLPDIVTYLKNYGRIRPPQDPELAKMLSGFQVVQL